MLIYINETLPPKTKQAHNLQIPIPAPKACTSKLLAVSSLSSPKAVRTL